tara:strand:- start:68 stop:484 length:417 start_codon:yes stop_codon:yes gene_type:complete
MIKRYKLFLLIYIILLSSSFIYIVEPSLPWLLIYPGLAHRSSITQYFYSKRTIHQKREFKENIKDQLLMKSYVFEKNKYPYNVQAEHWVLWLSYSMSNDEIEYILDKELMGKEYKYYENPVYLRSVPDVIHYHVFIRK